jgi:hypothetical protein
MYIFLSDFFLEQGVIGGGELNDHELLKILSNKGYKVKKKNTSEIDLRFLKENIGNNFIISNFIFLKEEYKKFIQSELNYVIYEHDHKYLINRDPSECEDYICKKQELINVGFYQNAKAILCQSLLHTEIISKNLKKINAISLSGNLWSEEDLELMRKLSENKKSNFYSIINSINPIKNTNICIKYCHHKQIPFKLISKMPRQQFLTELSKNEGLVFFPGVVETLNRVCVEAKAMNCKVVTNKKVGATSEEWFSLKGEPLLEEMYKMRESIPKLIIEVFE